MVINSEINLRQIINSMTNSTYGDGVDSIINELDSRDFIRVRVGISRPMETRQADVVDYVLGDFTTEERQIISQAIARVSEAILCLLAEGLAAAMNKYN